MSRILTFYSYKGGVGRSFALANIAVLLAERGHRVLVVDWDLEAPGLNRYFRPFLEDLPSPKRGLIYLLHESAGTPKADWRDHVSTVQIRDGVSFSLIPSGDDGPDYPDSVRSFAWGTYFAEQNGGSTLERWREEWKKSFDFVLLDSRTGITDAGGVCTILLPDILIFVFVANEQSFQCGKEVVLGIQKARRELAVRRPPVAVLPLLGRFDGREEVDEAQRWLDRFSLELKPFYDDWLPSRYEPRQMLELTKIPYITKFSFGEPLPVLSQGITDPDGAGFYLDNVVALLSSDFRDAARIIGPEPDTSSAIIEAVHRAIDSADFELARSLVQLVKLFAPNDLTADVLDRIDESERLHRSRQEIEPLIESAKRLVEACEFDKARDLVSGISGETEDFRLLKDSLLDMIASAEKIYAQVNAAIDESKKLVETGEYQRARELILDLPETPRELAVLKKNLVDQIAATEKQNRLHTEISAAIDASKALVARADFGGARSIISALPCQPKELTTLKNNLLEQIDDVEHQFAAAKAENNNLLGRLTRMGVNMSLLSKLVRESGVDEKNPVQFNAFLKAAVQQLTESTASKPQESLWRRFLTRIGRTRPTTRT